MHPPPHNHPSAAISALLRAALGRGPLGGILSSVVRWRRLLKPRQLPPGKHRGQGELAVGSEGSPGTHVQADNKAQESILAPSSLRAPSRSHFPPPPHSALPFHSEVFDSTTQAVQEQQGKAFFSKVGLSGKPSWQGQVPQ